MALADQFDKKAEQLLETAESIRETADIMTGVEAKKTPVIEKTVPTPPATTPAPPPTIKPVIDQPSQSSQKTPLTTTTIAKVQEPTKPINNLSTPEAKIPKRIKGKTKLAPMEKLILNALDGKHKGLHKNKIVTYCRRNGNIGTHNSITAALVKLKKNGYVICVDRAIYALPNALNQN